MRNTANYGVLDTPIAENGFTGMAVGAAMTGLRPDWLPTPLAVAMSGSGPSCFALFRDQDQCDQAAADLSPKLKAAGLKAWACSLRSDGVRIAS
jgi:shikimate kinase